jgi:plasmid stabilization system protein ParE
MTYHVIIQPRAERDIHNAAFWILEQSKSAATALRWARSIRAKIDTLKSSPLRCPIDPDSDAYGVDVRVLLFGKRKNKYRILFHVDEGTVHVLTIRHSAQQSIAEELAEEDDE